MIHLQTSVLPIVMKITFFPKPKNHRMNHKLCRVVYGLKVKAAIKNAVRKAIYCKSA